MEGGINRQCRSNLLGWIAAREVEFGQIGRDFARKVTEVER